MIAKLIAIDQKAFVAIHHDMANSVFDVIMPLIREPLAWLPLYLLFAFMAIRRYKTNGLYILLATALIVALCDRFSAGLVKPFVERLRPCHEPSLAIYIRNLVDCGGQYGFISSHATNHFGMAVIFTWFFKKISSLSFLNWAFYGWAGLISFAQIYVGKHYPGDVIAGMLAGIIIGKLILNIFTRLPMIKKISKI